MKASVFQDHFCIPVDYLSLNSLLNSAFITFNPLQKAEPILGHYLSLKETSNNAEPI